MTDHSSNNNSVMKTLNPNKVWIPVLIGLSIVFYLFYSDPEVNLGMFKQILDAKTLPFLIAILAILIRDAGYVYRIRTLTEKQLTWGRSFYTIVLWEFASAVTPSVIGGTAVAVFILLKEKIKAGRATAYVMLSSILDNAFFVLFAPIVLWVGGEGVFPVVKVASFSADLKSLFWISYVLYFVYCSIFSFALFIRPRGFKMLLFRICSLPFLKKKRRVAYAYGEEVEKSSLELRGKPVAYWFRIIFSTILVWVARYVMLNCLIAAFVNIDFIQNIQIFSKQIVMWIIMVISPTPGSSGTAEFFFREFFTPFLGKYTFLAGILWRMLSYYPYLILGAIFLPRWVRKRFMMT